MAIKVKSLTNAAKEANRGLSAHTHPFLEGQPPCDTISMTTAPLRDNYIEMLNEPHIDAWEYFKMTFQGPTHEIKRPDFVQFNEKKETVTLVDDPEFPNKKVTVVKRSDEDEYDPVQGFLWAYFLHHAGESKTQAKKYLDKVLKDSGVAKKKARRYTEHDR